MFEKFPIFSFGDYTIRAIDPLKDAQGFLRYVSRSEVAAFIGGDNVPKNIEESYKELTYWASLYSYGRSYYWAIANKDDEIIGTAGYNNINRQHRRGELSYDLSVDYWGKGVMLNSLFHIIGFGFEKMGLVRIQATVGQHNPRSIKLLEKLNFKKEGELAKYEFLQGKFHDFYMYAVTRDV